MGGSAPRKMQQRASLSSALLLLLCSLSVQPSQAFFGARSALISRLLGDGFSEEQVPMTVIVPDYSPRPAPHVDAPSPAPARTPLPGSNNDMPRLPSERWSSGAPSSSGNAGAPVPAAASTAFISSNPAVPLPAGVEDSATVLPMPTPGQQEPQDVGMGTLLQARTVPLVMMLSFWALW